MRSTMVLALAAPAAALLVAPAAHNASAPVLVDIDEMDISHHNFMEVNLGPFASAAEACDYCFGSFTKKGDKPAGPVAPFCVCMAYPSDGGYNMFCSTPPSSAGYIAEKGGCRCKAKDMQAMGQTTCAPIV